MQLIPAGPPRNLRLPTQPVKRTDEREPGTGPSHRVAGLMAPDALQVPLFIQPGDLIRVDTRTGTYMERA